MDASYLEDASGFTGYADAVYTPASEQDVIEIVRSAAQSGTPLTVAGAGTGVTGGRVPQGGWVVSLERFTTVRVEQGFAAAGAGVLLKDLQAAASRTAQFYAPDPTENWAALGGSIATNASGSRSFRYGSTRNHVLSLRCVFMDGTARELRRGDPLPFEVPAIPLPNTTKNTAGYQLRPGMDWIDLLCGSEGTLAIITAATVRLLPQPRELLTGVVFFDDDAAALDAVDAWRSRPKLRMLEYMDAGSLALLRPAWPDIPERAASALLVEEEVEDDAVLDEWLEMAPEDSWFAAGAADRERFRRFRHALPEAVNALVRSRGFQKLGTDYAVPIEQNRAMLTAYRAALEPRFAGKYVVFGHIGDAHVHVNVLPESEAMAGSARSILGELAIEAVRLGGTVSAEHGLGKRKAGLLELQYPPGAVAAMKAVKSRLDPQWLLGRSTLFAPP